MNNIFYYNDRIIMDDSLYNMRKILLDTKVNKYCLFFEFKNIKASLKNVKKIILELESDINFNNIYFYNLNDFINLVLNREIYLPNSINLFINKSCYIGCNFCDIDLKKTKEKSYLKKVNIEKFLSKYPLGDNMNYNILGQGDPLYNPEIFEILNYIKSIGGNITLFSGGKAILFFKDFVKLNLLVDEFKINLSASNMNIYNLMHSNKITQNEFNILLKKLISISNKTTLLTVVMKNNIGDLYNYYNFAKNNNFLGLEIKKDANPKNINILNNNKILANTIKLIKIFSKNKNLNIISDIKSNLIYFNNMSLNLKKRNTILSNIVESILNNKLDSDTILKIKSSCYQFGESLDLTEDNIISICCTYKSGKIGNIFNKEPFYNNSEYIMKKTKYKNNLPNDCLNCPMVKDKAYLKYDYVNKL